MEGMGEVRRLACSMTLSGSSTQWSVSRKGSIPVKEGDGRREREEGGGWKGKEGMVERYRVVWEGWIVRGRS